MRRLAKDGENAIPEGLIWDEKSLKVQVANHEIKFDKENPKINLFVLLTFRGRLVFGLGQRLLQGRQFGGGPCYTVMTLSCQTHQFCISSNTEERELLTLVLFELPLREVELSLRLLQVPLQIGNLGSTGSSSKQHSLLIHNNTYD